MPGTYFVFMPVHSGKRGSQQLHPVHTDISYAGFRILGMNNRQGNEGAAIFWPTGNHRQFVEIGRSNNHFLAGSPAPDYPGHPGGKLREFGKYPQLISNGFFWSCKQLKQRLNLAADFIEMGNTQGNAHSFFAAISIHQNREIIAGIFKKNCFVPVRRFT